MSEIAAGNHISAARRRSTAALGKRAWRARWILLPWVVLAIGIPAAFFLFTIVRDAVDDVARLRFEREASDARRVIDVRMHSYAGVLYGLRSLFATHNSVSRLQFRRFVQSLDLKSRYPSLESVNYMAYVPASERKHFEESVRMDTSLTPEGYPNFSIKPPGERPEYFVLVYLEPMAGFEFAFGRDLGANPAATDPAGVAAAVRLTRDSGQLTASGLPLRMKAAGRDYIALAMRLAVYRTGMPVSTPEERAAAFLGSVGAGFNVDDLMQGVFGDRTSRYMRFTLYDVGSADGGDASRGVATKRMLFNSKGTVSSPVDASTVDRHDSFSRVLPMQIGGRTWEAHFSARKEEVIERVDALLPWVVLIGGLVSSGLLFAVLYSLASSRSRAVEIANEITRDLRENQQALHTSAQQLTALSRRLVEVQEAERRQLSRELHDRVGQNLTALSINLDILRTALPGNENTEHRARLTDSSALLESTVDSMENVMAELRPPMLDDYGLLSALDWYAKEFSKRTGVKVSVQGQEGTERPAPEEEIALFRIAQEALTNVAKHARANHAEIVFDHSNSHCIMTVTDDGIGFDAAAPSDRLGMVTMRERSQAVGGRFEIRAAPGHGTHIAIQIPA